MKLHLGCGQKYLEGYVNIDFPSSKHTLFTKSIADKYADITRLHYPKNSIEVIRLHHVFEHFSRPVALALLASWWSWLKIDGTMRIEVPDFDKSASRVLSPFTRNGQKCVALRHIFGSQEASWANHCEGWSEGRLRTVFKKFGFQPEKITKSSWRCTYNIEIIATKTNKTMKKNEFEQIAKSILADYLVDKSLSEIRLSQVWMKIYNEQVRKTWAK